MTGQSRPILSTNQLEIDELNMFSRGVRGLFEYRPAEVFTNMKSKVLWKENHLYLAANFVQN